MLVSVTVTVRSVVEAAVEFDGSVVANCPLLELESTNEEVPEDDAWEDCCESDPEADEPEPELPPVDTLTPGTVRVPRLSSVTATSAVGAAICVVVLPSLTATSRTPAVTVTSGARGKRTFPGFLRWFCGLWKFVRSNVRVGLGNTSSCDSFCLFAGRSIFLSAY